MRDSPAPRRSPARHRHAERGEELEGVGLAIARPPPGRAARRGARHAKKPPARRRRPRACGTPRCRAAASERERALGLRREEGGERLVAPLRADDRLDRELRVELRRGADRREHRVALGERSSFSSVAPIASRCVAAMVRSMIGVGGELDAEQAEAVDHARRAAAGGGDHRDSAGPCQVERLAVRRSSGGISSSVSSMSTRTMPQSRK